MERAYDCVPRVDGVTKVTRVVPVFPTLYLTNEVSLSTLGRDAALDQHDHGSTIPCLAILPMRRREPGGLWLPVLRAKQQHDDVGLTHAGQACGLWARRRSSELLGADHLVPERGRPGGDRVAERLVARDER